MFLLLDFKEDELIIFILKSAELYFI